MKKLILSMFSVCFIIGSAQATTAPEFNLTAPDGKRVQLSKLLKEGPVLLDFWATWCKPCIKGMPKLEEIHKKYKDRGLTIVGINEDGPRGQNRIRPFLRGRKISFQIAIDSDGGVMKRMQVRALPTTILIAQDGEIVLRQAGLSDPAPLIEAIEMLLPKKESKDESE
ncbi:MAG: TlpA family protein disulfide reductase [Candidatus Latescibacteria bacterium]|jgi:thiol-disulfide isomerase/thioredoxin|nr:TlpA family protein disulfide reductase [Candidatus Latescibacterota bacterium]MBT4140359.1 TlpA family protein disulfide reductase [Candidatus Latescibacterota bacterium]MBT5829717.1 TlpA family protein disulfide reductase [Candidatus Latescibacterota bacterium]